MDPEPLGAQGLTVERHRDARDRSIAVRRLLLLVLLAAVMAALFDVFGQRPTTSTTRSTAATMSVQAPAELRSGLIFQVRVDVTARRGIQKPILVFDKGWWESMTLNAAAPEPTDWSSKGGRVALTYGRLPAGQAMTNWLYFQVNPTNVGHRSEDVQLYDGSQLLARTDRDVTIFP
jgi:hypothetical protein